MSGTTIERRKPPSWLWGVTDSERVRLLRKQDSNGRAIWNITELSPAEVLRTPITSVVDLAVAKLALLAELDQAPETRACDVCRTPMGVERAIQVCDECHNNDRQNGAS